MLGNGVNTSSTVDPFNLEPIVPNPAAVSIFAHSTSKVSPLPET